MRVYFGTPSNRPRLMVNAASRAAICCDCAVILAISVCAWWYCRVSATTVRHLPSPARFSATTASAISRIEKNTKSLAGIVSTCSVAPQLPPSDSRCRSIQALARPNRFAGCVVVVQALRCVQDLRPVQSEIRLQVGKQIREVRVGRLVEADVRHLWINLTPESSQAAPGAVFSGSDTSLPSVQPERKPSGAISEPGKGTCASGAGGYSVPTRMIFRLSGSFAFSPGLFDPLRLYPVLGGDFVYPSHPRAVEKRGCDRKGDCCMSSCHR